MPGLEDLWPNLEALLSRAKPGPAASPLLDAALNAIGDRHWRAEGELRQLPEVQAILNADDESRRNCILEAAARDDYGSMRVLSIIGRRRVALTPDDIASILAPPEGKEARQKWLYSEAVRVMVKHIETAYDAFAEAEQNRLRPLVERAADVVADAATATRLRKLVSSGRRGVALELIDGDDDVDVRLRAVFKTSDEPEDVRARLLALLAGYPASGRPAKKWLAEAAHACDELEKPGEFAAALLDAALEAGDSERQHTYDRHEYTLVRYVGPATETLLCGAAAFAGVTGDAELLRRLRRLAVKSVTVIGGQFGTPRSLRLANACAQAIAAIADAASLTELLALERSVRHGTLLKQIRKAIDALAEARGMTRDQLLERAVEEHDLDTDGTKETSLSRGRARIEVDGRSAALVYLDETGKRKKSFPAELKELEAATLAELRDQVKQIRKTIAGERHRLDGLMAADRRWSMDDWRAFYLDHPVTGRLTRSLVWGFRSGESDLLAIPRGATVGVNSGGEEVPIPGDAEVRLWHPVHSPEDDVHAWRLRVLDELIVQPFKQAFRELYVLTPAEQETRVYSNRFAGHVIRQVQARALMKGRGWQPVPVGWWDDGIDHGVARRTFDTFGIRAEFFYDPILDIHPDTTDLYPYCTSDQVRFFATDTDEPLELGNVPLLVFTEAMRDVDLFIGVTSVGADPEWLDRGEGRRFENYWQSFSFGELSAAGEIRRQVLAELLPRLAIADRCELDDRYLTVRGELRTYRIHLGSGNILMSPNDQYLCIVAARDSRAEKLFLPFDDDPVMSLILSKAFLLANDTAIKDKTITNQIKRG